MNKIILTLVLIFMFLTTFYSQTNDSIKVYKYDEIVVTAERFESPLSSSSSTISKLNSETLKTFPIISTNELFKYLPGFNVTSTSGYFSSPIINVRGFRGGGEAEYIAAYIDNFQINDVETGLIDWSLLSNIFFNNIEVLRGGSSSLYGDFAMGGVINVQTFSEDFDKTKISIGGGSYDTYRLNFYSSHYLS